MSDRRQESYAVRLEAAELARSRQHPDHKANGDEQKYAGDKYFMSFTKGLPHEQQTGLLHNPQDFVEFRRAIDEGFIDPFTDRVRHGSEYEVNAGIETKVSKTDDFRQWEAPTAGVVYELEGPDPQAVTMPPAPPLIGADGKANQELVLEIAEVYELAILRDVPFNDFETGSGNTAINAAIGRLNALPYISNQTGRPRKLGIGGNLDLQTVFRGSSPGVEIGPYLSQFLLIGNVDLNGGGSVAEGKITYGVLQIEQKVPTAKPGKDFMTDMDTYVKVQRGLKPDPCINQEKETYVLANGSDANPPDRPAHRFISTPRDLATYVHYDALYEAYLNACIILLGMGTPFDPTFDHLSGVGVAAGNPATRRHAGGFALYGGPHILNLVTEVATRALKAVRFQKFNNHIRLRPEALAARIELLRSPSSAVAALTPPALTRDIGKFQSNLTATLAEIQGGVGKGTHLLPMAFPEGSPMHPAYGAGHATVAGACVTILKAFFDTSAVLAETSVKDKCTGKIKKEIKFKRYESGDQAIAFRAPSLPNLPDVVPTDEVTVSNMGQVPSGGEISVECEDNQPKIKVKVPKGLDSSKPPVPSQTNQFLTLEGELNKLAANISIGRNMAGVHYFSDYYDSIRMGEEIAIGILEEQALTYSTDPFVLSLPTFDGDVVRIGRR